MVHRRAWLHKYLYSNVHVRPRFWDSRFLWKSNYENNQKNLLIYCHAKMKMKWQNKIVYSWIITRYTTVTLLLGALYMYTGVFPFLFIYFLHLRLFKHYLSLEMYYIKVMINFTKNNHFLFYFAYHYLPLFFSPDKKPILLSKTIHA